MIGANTLSGQSALMATTSAGLSAVRTVPAFIGESAINIEGSPGRRLIAVYRTHGCEYQKKKGGGCTMCGFHRNADPGISDEDLLAQHAVVLERLTAGHYTQVDLLSLGNCFNDREIPPHIRNEWFRTAAETASVRRVLVESRLEYVSEDKLIIARAHLRADQRLVFSTGYESYNAHIRNRILKKGMPEANLKKCLKLCRESGVDFAGYVLVKPPGLSEQDAVRDAADTAVHVLRQASLVGCSAYVAFEPTFVVSGTPLEANFPLYQPPWLWTVADALVQSAAMLHMENTMGKFFVGLSDEGLSNGRFAHNRCSCDGPMREAIQAFNADQNIVNLRRFFRHPLCSCYKRWLEM